MLEVVCQAFQKLVLIADVYVLMGSFTSLAAACMPSIFDVQHTVK